MSTTNCRRWLHSRRYGVNSAFMFRNVELEINSMCNRRCSYCPNAVSNRPLGYMPESLFHKIIRELAEMDYDGMVAYHFYGEPLLDKRLLDFVAYTASRVPKCRPVIYSNGDFLTLESFRQFIKAGLWSFWITQHDSSIPPNLQHILDKATELEKEHIDIHFPGQIGLMNRSGLIPTMPIPLKPLPVPCDWPLGNLVITMTGNAVLCCNDYFETEVIGNVAKQSLCEIWCSERYEAFRSALSRGDRSVSQLCMRCDSVPSRSTLLRIVTP